MTRSCTPILVLGTGMSFTEITNIRGANRTTLRGATSLASSTVPANTGSTSCRKPTVISDKVIDGGCVGSYYGSSRNFSDKV